jgi:two-component sensor histidine kinase
MVQNKHKKILVFLLHVLIWSIVFSFPLLYAYNDLSKNMFLYIKIWLPLLFSAVIFYINFFVLTDQFLFKKRLTLFFAINVLMIIIALYGMDWARDIFFKETGPEPRGIKHAYHKLYFFMRTAFSFLLTAGISVAIRVTERWYRMEAEKKNMENEHLKSELSHLRYQIQPHFFFNTLNNIYTLVDAAPEKAKETIHSMSKLMRHMLYNAEAEKVSLENEIVFLKSYIELMKIRIAEQVDLKFSFPDHTGGVQVAPLLFIALVENSFKHGISASRPSFINIQMTLVQNKITLVVSNSNFPKDKEDKNESGIGMENLMRRLKLIYPGRYLLKQKVENEVYTLELTIDL